MFWISTGIISGLKISSNTWRSVLSGIKILQSRWKNEAHPSFFKPTSVFRCTHEALRRVEYTISDMYLHNDFEACCVLINVNINSYKETSKETII